MTTTLADVCLLIEDCLHATAPTVDSGFPLIRTPNIGKGRLDFTDVQRVSAETYEIWTRRAVPQPNDLILAREAPAGNVAIVREGEEVCLGQRTVLIRPNPDCVDPAYLCYFLLAPSQQGQLLSKATGATAQHVNMKDIRRLALEQLPLLDTQRRIAGILSAYDDLIENNRRRMALLEEAMHRLYRHWFVHLRFPGHEHTPIHDGVPEGWSKVRVTDAISINPATPVRRDDLLPFIPMTSLQTNSMVIDEIEQRPAGGGAKFKNGDTLLARITPCLENGKTAFVQFLDDEQQAATGSTEFIVLRAQRVTPYWVYCLARSEHFRQFAINSMVGSDGRQRVQPAAFEKYSIMAPPVAVLQAFDTVAEPVFRQIQVLTVENQRLRAARDLLLPRLMNGSIPL